MTAPDTIGVHKISNTARVKLIKYMTLVLYFKFPGEGSMKNFRKYKGSDTKNK